MSDIELLNSNSQACLSVLEVVLGIIDYKDKPKQQERLKKFVLKLKLANTHKKKADLAYIMLAMLSDIESKQPLNTSEKNKIANAINLSIDDLFRDNYHAYIQKDNADKIKFATKCLKDFLALENKISKVNEENRNKKQLAEKEEKKVNVKINIKSEEPIQKITITENKKEVEEIVEDKEIEIPGIEEQETLILPSEVEIDKLLDTSIFPKVNTDDIKPVSDNIPEIETDKSEDELINDYLTKSFIDSTTKKTRTKKDIIDGIENYIKNNSRIISHSHSIPYDDMEEFRNLFPELRSYKSAYYNLDTIENIVETSCIYNTIEKSGYVDIETLMNLAINAHSLVTKRILTYDSEANEYEYKDARQLIANINLPNPIKVYDRAYNLFFERFNSLSKEDQREICVSIEKYMPYEYKSLFQVKEAIPYEIDTIVDSSLLKSKINETVKHEIVVNNAIKFDDIDNKEIPMLLAYATIYMSEEDVVEIYHSQENKIEKEYREIKLRSDVIKKEDYDRIVKLSGKLQEWFASALVINKSRVDSKVRKEIKDPELLKENLIYITRTVLKEEPLFAREQKDIRVKKIDSSTIVKDFYNSSRLKKTQVRVFNNWNKLPKLIILNGYDKDVSKKVS